MKFLKLTYNMLICHSIIDDYGKVVCRACGVIFLINCPLFALIHRHYNLYHLFFSLIPFCCCLSILPARLLSYSYRHRTDCHFLSKSDRLRRHNTDVNPLLFYYQIVSWSRKRCRRNRPTTINQIDGTEV